MAYKNIMEWVDEQRKLVRDNWDNVILFTGIEGAGKSTLMRQVMFALDPSFNVDRIHFRLEQFLMQAPVLPRYSALTWDEARLNKRLAMHGSTLETLNFLQDCRGLNLHIGICFPHERLLDAAVKDHRVRWNLHVVKRGGFVLRKRIKKRGRSRMGPVEYWDWHSIQGFNFKEDTGDLRTAYEAKKEDHMRRTTDGAKSGMEDLGFDLDAMEEILQGAGVG